MLRSCFVLVTLFFHLVASFSVRQSRVSNRNQLWSNRNIDEILTPRDALKNKLTKLLGPSRLANYNSEDDIIDTIKKLSDLNPTSDVSTSLDFLGEWDLIYSDDDATRSSPFFWAFRKAFRDIDDPLKFSGSRKIADSIFMITDNVPFKNIGACTHTVSEDASPIAGTRSGTLISRVELGFPLALQSVMQTTSKWRSTNDPSLVEIEVETTAIVDSTITNLLPGIFNTGKLPAFPSGSALELVKPGSSTVYLRVAYLDDTMRIVRNEADDKVFVYNRLI